MARARTDLCVSRSAAKLAPTRLMINENITLAFDGVHNGVRVTRLVAKKMKRTPVSAYAYSILKDSHRQAVLIQ